MCGSRTQVWEVRYPTQAINVRYRSKKRGLVYYPEWAHAKRVCAVLARKASLIDPVALIFPQVQLNNAPVKNGF